MDDLRNYLKEVSNIDDTFSTNLNDVISTLKVVKIDSTIDKEFRRGKSNKRGVFDCLKQSIGYQTLCGPSDDAVNTPSHDIRLTLPLLSLDALVRRFRALRLLHDPILDSLRHSRPVYLGGVGSKYLFVQDFLVACRLKRSTGTSSARQLCQEPPFRHVVQVHACHARFHPRSIATTLQSCFDYSEPEITTTTSAARIWDILNEGFAKTPHRTLCVVHSADTPCVSSFMADILLPLRREHPERLFLLCTFEDLRFEALLDMWNAYKDPDYLVLPYIHTLLDVREEIKMQFMEARARTERSLVPIVKDDMSSALSKLLVSAYGPLEEDENMDHNESSETDGSVEIESTTLWDSIRGVLEVDNQHIKDVLRTAFDHHDNADWRKTHKLRISGVSQAHMSGLQQFFTNLKNLPGVSDILTTKHARTSLTMELSLNEMQSMYDYLKSK